MPSPGFTSRRITSSSSRPANSSTREPIELAQSVLMARHFADASGAMAIATSYTEDPATVASTRPRPTSRSTTEPLRA